MATNVAPAATAASAATNSESTQETTSASATRGARGRGRARGTPSDQQQHGNGRGRGRGNNGRGGHPNESSRGGGARARGRGHHRGGGGHNNHGNGNGNQHEHVSDEEAASIALALSLSQQDAAAAATTTTASHHPGVVAGVKGNANHLLSFHFAPVAVAARAPIRRARRAPTSSFNKETFVHANYHFVVSAADHTPSLSDPDIPVDWQHVQLVFYPINNTTPICCPICLDPPVAAKMTKCGHVFCYACILHYLELADQEFDRCPLCFESVYLDSLKSLHFMKHEKYKVDDMVEFVLVKRSRDSVIPYSRADSRGITAAYTLQRAQFARITITRDIGDIITRERAELYDALHRGGLEDDTKMWLQAAIDEVNEREKRWYAVHGQPIPTRVPSASSTSSSSSSSSSSSIAPVQDPKLVRASSDPLSSKASESSFPALMRSPSAVTPSTIITNSNGGNKKAAVKTLTRLVGTATSPSVITSTSASSTSSPLSPSSASSSSTRSSSDDKKSSKKTKLSAKASAFTPVGDTKVNDTTDSKDDTTTNHNSGTARPRDAFLEPGETDQSSSNSTSITSSSSSSTTSMSDSMIDIKVEHKTIAANEVRKAKNDNNDDYYFYQSCDGQQLYVHNLNQRALKAQFGSEDAFPHKIVARLLEDEKFTQNDVTRRRYKYLAHLPATAEFTIALIDHTTLCSPDTNQKFASEMKEMSVARAKRLRQLKVLNKQLDRRAAEAQSLRRGPTLANALANDVAAGQLSFPNLADNPFGFSLSGDATPSVSSTTSNSNTNNGSNNNNNDMPLAARLSHWSSVAKRGMAGNDTWTALPNPVNTTPATTTSTVAATATGVAASNGMGTARMIRQPSNGSSPSIGPATAPSSMSSTAAAIAAITNAATVKVPAPVVIPMTPIIAPVVRQASGRDESRPDRVFAPMARKSDSLFGTSATTTSSSPLLTGMAKVSSPSLTAMSSPLLTPSSSSSSSAAAVPPMTAWAAPSPSPSSPILTATPTPATSGAVPPVASKKKGKQLLSSGSQRAYR